MGSDLFFRFFLGSLNMPVTVDGDLWHSRIPMGPEPGLQRPENALSYGDYFLAVKHFLNEERMALLAKAAHRHLKEPMDVRDIGRVDIFLEKHGAFYHPCRVKIRFRNGHSGSFAVNVAVSKIGLAVIDREYECLNRLGRTIESSFLPEVFGRGEVRCSGGSDVKLFVAQWFEGFHEFHASENGIRLWDGDGLGKPLSRDQCHEVFRQVAFILTHYYSLKTFEHISSWHHASGDFVVRSQADRVEIKLITARQYQPLMANDRPDPVTVLEALMAFLLDLSIRTRIDRLNGVGKYVWADEVSVAATVEGFYQAMKRKGQIDVIPGEPYRWTREVFSSLDIGHWKDLAANLMDSYPAVSPEIPLIETHLSDHLEVFCKALEIR